MPPFHRNACFLLFLSTSLFHPSVLLAGVLVCKTVPFVQTTAIVTGILTMTCIAIERYQGIVFPLKMRRQYSSKRAHKMLGIFFARVAHYSFQWMCLCVKGNIYSVINNICTEINKNKLNNHWVKPSRVHDSCLTQAILCFF